MQLTDTTMRVYGAENFPGQCAGRRWRGSSCGATVYRQAVYGDRRHRHRLGELAGLLGVADGDIVYISFDSPAAKDRAPVVLGSDAWRKLSANRDNRIFAVNNEVWQTGEGIVAARGILADLRWVNAPIN